MHVRDQPARRIADHDMGSDHAIGPDLERRSPILAPADSTRAVESICRHGTTSAIMAPTSASATIWPATLASPRNHHLFRRAYPGHVVLERVARHHRLAKFRLVDGQEIDLLRSCRPDRRRMQSAPAVCAMPSITSTPGITGCSGKMPEKLRLVDGHVLDADARLVAADVDDAVDHQERIAVRQQPQDRGMSADSRRRRLASMRAILTPSPLDAGASAVRRAARSTVAISRNHCRTGRAG